MIHVVQEYDDAIQEVEDPLSFLIPMYVWMSRAKFETDLDGTMACLYAQKIELLLSDRGLV